MIKNIILIFQCKDQKGIIAKISSFITDHSANIIHADQHSTDIENGQFFMRLLFCYDDQKISFSMLNQAFQPIANEFDAQWKMVDKDAKLKAGILVSKPDHCLAELLYQWHTNELDIDIPFVISNHDCHQDLLSSFQIPYIVIDAANKVSTEQKILDLSQQYDVDFLILARYMQILSPEFLAKLKKDVINIHHSFLPSFVGADPYRQAKERGVKLIGATTHFVTAELDQGPIITQLVESVSHKDSIDDLKRKGKNLEKMALTQSIRLYREFKIIQYMNKTIVF